MWSLFYWIWNSLIQGIMPRDEKNCFAICEQQRRRSDCADATTKAQIRLRWCIISAVWSALLLFAYGKNRFFHDSMIPLVSISCLDSMIPLVSISEISKLNLASVAEQAGLSRTWSEIPKTGFLVTRLISCNWISRQMHAYKACWTFGCAKTEGSDVSWSHFSLGSMLEFAWISISWICRWISQAEWPTSRENVPSGIFDQVWFNPACSATEAS